MYVIVARSSYYPDVNNCKGIATTPENAQERCDALKSKGYDHAEYFDAMKFLAGECVRS